MNAKNKLIKIFNDIDEETAKEVLDFTEYLLERKIKVFQTKTDSIDIEPFPMKKKWENDPVIKREDAYDPGRGL